MRRPSIDSRSLSSTKGTIASTAAASLAGRSSTVRCRFASACSSLRPSSVGLFFRCAWPSLNVSTTPMVAAGAGAGPPGPGYRRGSAPSGARWRKARPGCAKSPWSPRNSLRIAKKAAGGGRRRCLGLTPRRAQPAGPAVDRGRRPARAPTNRPESPAAVLSDGLIPSRRDIRSGIVGALRKRPLGCRGGDGVRADDPPSESRLSRRLSRRPVSWGSLHELPAGAGTAGV
ncbi:hypothetical protein DFJ74DRAFT_381357 [Hyaloraphidium curvatum]|nr:hypothetical protein DFJ74DRAFT_381357 [Hyaloraphidium curvatum]